MEYHSINTINTTDVSTSSVKWKPDNNLQPYITTYMWKRQVIRFYNTKFTRKSNGKVKQTLTDKPLTLKDKYYQ